MLHIIYDFVKFSSSLFILAGLTCFFNGLNYLGFLMILSFVIIKVIDSDWAFDKFNFKNHSGVVIMITFSLILINLGNVYQNMKDSPLFIKPTETQKINYMMYENSLFNMLKSCTELYNTSSTQNISQTDSTNVTETCTDALSSIDKTKLPYGEVPKQIVPMISDMKTNFKYLALNLSRYDYTNNSVANKSTKDLLKMNVEDISGLIEKTRRMMGLSVNLESNKKNFIKL